MINYLVWIGIVMIASMHMPALADSSDEVPVGFVTFFTGGACPVGWKDAEYAQGRLLLFTTQKERIGESVGNRMQAAEQPTHLFDSGGISLALKDKWFGGFNGCSNPVGQAAAYKWPFQCKTSDGDLPYHYLRVCEKMATRAQTDWDPLPFGTYAFFNRSNGQCPDDWVIAAAADGRFAVPLMADGEVGKTVATSWSNGSKSPSRHTHTLSYKHPLARVGVRPFGANRSGVADPDQVVNLRVGAGRHLTLPYVRLLACRKNVFLRDRKATEIPKNMSIFFGGKACVDDWQPVKNSAGRFIVGLTPTALSGQNFGGPALNNAEDREHSHSCKIQYHVKRQDVCINGGDTMLAAMDSGATTLDTSSGAAKVPFIQLSHCQWSGG